MSLIPLGHLLGKSLKRAGILRQVASAVILDEFTKIVNELCGNAVSERVRGLYVKDRVLTVACLSPAAAQELKFRERKILEKLNSHSKMPVERLRYLL